METREQLEDYAISICLALWERTAKRRNQQLFTEMVDSAGYTATFLENFCRPLWGMAPVLKERELFIQVDGEKREVCRWIREVLAEGTLPGHPRSWERYRDSLGEISYANQLTTELAGLMVGIFWAKEKLWEPFLPQEKRRIADWLYEISMTAFEHSWPNNHYWFPMLILLVLKRFGFCFPRTDAVLTEGLERLDHFYLGNGWYQDGEFGRFDYYIAWSHHFYPLIWTLIETEEFPLYHPYRDRYLRRTEAFLSYYAHFFDRQGCHVAMGRSLAYRFAASALFPAAVLAGCSVDLGLARNILMKNITFFQEQCPLETDGTLGPGFLYSSAGFVENYTSDGGAYWCSKAFFSLLLPKEHPFWNVPARPLPVELSDYVLPSSRPDIHIVLSGEQASGGVALYNNTASYVQHGVLQHPFNDLAACYGKFVYHSQSGFGLSVPDNRSIDNMISLVTPDRTMCSHRIGFRDLGETEGTLVSIHTPFANDSGSTIKTWLMVLPDGYHLRVHRVVLAQPYWIQEGGFSLGCRTDYKKTEQSEKHILLCNEIYRSEMSTCASVPITYETAQIHPGLHSFAPMAFYPKYQTKEICPPGEYQFASVFRFSGQSALPYPQILWNEDFVEVIYGGKSYVVHW